MRLSLVLNIALNIVLSLAAVLPALVSVAAHSQERAELHLFQYGLTSTDQRKALFEDFRYVLEEKMPRLSAELDLNDDLPALAALAIKPVTDGNNQLRRPNELIGNLSQRQKYWQDVGALGLLTGIIDDRGETPSIKTTLFWGELKPPLEQQMIDLQLPLSGDFFDTTFDSHSVAILFAIANQPTVTCAQFPAVMRVLSEAHKRAQAVAEQQADLGAELEQKVVESIESLRAECNR